MERLACEWVATEAGCVRIAPSMAYGRAKI
jgi:hypothetical protein